MTLQHLGAQAGAIAAICLVLGGLWRYAIRHIVRWCRLQATVLEKLEGLLAFPERHEISHTAVNKRLSELESHIVTTTTTSVAFVPPQTHTGKPATP